MVSIVLTISTTSVSAGVCCGILGLLRIVLACWSGLRVVRAAVRMRLCLEVAVDEVDLLEAPEALPDLLGADLSDALDRLELAAGRGQHHVEGAEFADHVLDHDLRQARDPPQDAMTTGRHG